MNWKNELEKWIGKFSLAGPLPSILEFDRLFKEVKEKLPESEWEKIEAEEPELSGRLLREISYKRLLVYETYIDRWNRGLFVPNEEELKSLKKYQKNFDTKIIPYYNAIKQKFPSTASAIEEEEKKSKEIKKTLDKLLEQDKHRQKAEDLLKKYKNNPLSSDDKGTRSEFDEKITNLQNQIKDLENKQSQDSSLEKDHKYKQELERLKAELEELKSKNKQKDKSQNEKGQNKKSNFPTGLVTGCGIVIVILLLVIIFLVRKINK